MIISDPVIASLLVYPTMKHEEIPKFAKTLVLTTDDAPDVIGIDHLDMISDALSAIHPLSSNYMGEN